MLGATERRASVPAAPSLHSGEREVVVIDGAVRRAVDRLEVHRPDREHPEPRDVAVHADPGLPDRRGLEEQRSAVPAPAVRLAGRQGPLHVLVIGGSQGARALNERVPAALARMDEAVRPVVVHQSGARHLELLSAAYRNAHVDAECVALPCERADVDSERAEQLREIDVRTHSVRRGC